MALPLLALRLASTLLVAGPADPPLATYRGGTVTGDEYRGFLLATGQADEPAARRERLEAVALTESLEQEALASGLDREPAVVARLADVEGALLVGALTSAAERTAAVSDAEVEAALVAEEPNRHRPRTVRLRNIFKRVPPGAGPSERQAVRAAMDDLRRRILAGEDMGALASSESDSQTRFQDGLMGYVPPGALQPEVERVAFALAPGALTEVLESPDGFTLLRCEDVSEARVMPVEEARTMIRQGLRARKEAAARAALRAGLLAEAPVPAGADEDAAVRLRAAARARREGLDRQPELAARLRWARAQFLASELMTRRVERAAVAPTATEERAHFDASRARYTKPVEVDLSVVQWTLPAEPERMREQYADAEALRQRLQSGAVEFAEAARTASRHASAAAGGRLGWLPPRALAELGANVFRTVQDLQPGQTSRLVQQDRSLWLVKLWDRRPERPLSYEEALPLVEGELREAGRHAARVRLEAEARRALHLVETAAP